LNSGRKVGWRKEKREDGGKGKAKNDGGEME
jgi:hypothetical protein